MIYIKQKALNDVIDYMKGFISREACGLFISTNQRNSIDSFIPIPNVSENPHFEFRLSPQEYIKELHRIENEGHELLGIIHSHPNSSAYPSSLDINNWHYPNLSYWIYSIEENMLKGYIIKGNNILALPWTACL